MPANAHWSESVEWRHDRWDPMSNAPTTGPILEVRGRSANGKVLEPMHYADGGGEEQPRFKGWFVPCFDSTGALSYYLGVDPVEWQPIRATYEKGG